MKNICKKILKVIVLFVLLIAPLELGLFIAICLSPFVASSLSLEMSTLLFENVMMLITFAHIVLIIILYNIAYLLYVKIVNLLERW